MRIHEVCIDFCGLSEDGGTYRRCRCASGSLRACSMQCSISRDELVLSFPRTCCFLFLSLFLFYFYFYFFSICFLCSCSLFLSTLEFLGAPSGPAQCLRTRADSRLGRLRSIAPRRLATSIGRQRTDSALAVLGVDVELKSLFCAQRMLSVLALARSA